MSTPKAKPRIDPAFLKLAVAPHRDAILTALRGASFASSAYLELPVTGVPGVARVGLFAWPEPLGKTRRMALDVVRLDQARLETPIPVVFELRAEERPSVDDELPPVVVAAEAETAASTWCQRPQTLKFRSAEGPVVWQLVEEPRVESEVVKLDRTGAPIFGSVDTQTYCYRLSCPRCGRVRYSKPNSVHQICLCRVCTRQDQLRRRALTQYKQYKARSRRRKA